MHTSFVLLRRRILHRRFCGKEEGMTIGIIVYAAITLSLGVICVFAMFLILNDIKRIDKENRRRQNRVKEADKQRPFERAPTAADLHVEAKEEDTSVSFRATAGKTLDEQYRELDPVHRSYYDQIAACASGRESVTRHIKNNRYEEWKIGSLRLLRLKIRRGSVVCEFTFGSDFSKRAAQSKVFVKQSAYEVRAEDEASLGFVLESIDLAATAIEQERKRKRSA